MMTREQYAEMSVHTRELAEAKARELITIAGMSNEAIHKLTGTPTWRVQELRIAFYCLGVPVKRSL